MLLIILLPRFFLYFCDPMKIQNKRIFASILFVLISFVCVAQGPPDHANNPPHPKGGPPGGPPPPPFPIDGGLLVGAVFAIAFGARKVYISKK